MFAQMPQYQCTDGGVEIVADDIRNDVVRQVPSSSHHSLLHRPRIGADLEHLEIVVRFEHQQIGAAQMELHRVRDIAEVGDHADLDALRAEAETHRIDRVVRNSKAVDIDITNGKSGAGLKAIEPRCVLIPGNRGSREPGNENGDLEGSGQRYQAAHVIGVLVSDEDGIQAFRQLADRGHPRHDIALAEAGIDEKAGAFGAYESRVPRTAAREHTDFDDSAPPVPFSCRLGQRRAGCLAALDAIGGIPVPTSYSRAGQPTGKRLQINETPPYPWTTQTRNLDAAYSYDTEGKMTSVNYPTTHSYVYPNLVATAGPTYTYSSDSASRPIGLTGQNNYAGGP